jgi:hypothetical protein
MATTNTASTKAPPPTSLACANPRFGHEDEDDGNQHNHQHQQEQTTPATVHPSETQPEIMVAKLPDNSEEPLLPKTDRVISVSDMSTHRPLTTQPPAAPPSLRPGKKWLSGRATYLRALNAAKAPQHALLQSNDMWRNPRLHRINCLEPHAEMRGYRTIQEASAHEFAPTAQSANAPTPTGSLIQLLDGDLGEGADASGSSRGWRFAFSESPKKTPAGFEAPEFGDEEWDTVPVPSNWAMLG